MAAGAPAAFQSENTRVRPPISHLYFMSDPQALHVTRNVIPGKLGVDLHLHRVHIPLVSVVSKVISDGIFNERFKK